MTSLNKKFRRIRVPEFVIGSSRWSPTHEIPLIPVLRRHSSTSELRRERTLRYVLASYPPDRF